MVEQAVRGVMVEQGPQGAMAEQVVHGATAGQPLWPWPRHLARPLEPGPYSPPQKNPLREIMVFETLCGPDVGTGALLGLHSGTVALPGPDVGNWSTLWALRGNSSPFWA